MCVFVSPVEITETPEEIAYIGRFYKITEEKVRYMLKGRPEFRLRNLSNFAGVQAQEAELRSTGALDDEMPFPPKK